MTAAAELVLGLLLREQYRFAPAAVRAALEEGSLGDVALAELPLIRAAAAIAGGEPRRALHELEGQPLPDGSDELAVAEAIRRVAYVLDRNWFPGEAGAVLDEGDLERMLGEPVPPSSPRVGLLMHMAVNVLATLPTWRSVAESARVSGQAAVAAVVLQQAEEVGGVTAQYGAPSALGYLALVQADLLVRAGQSAAVPQLLGIVEAAYAASNDLAATASAWLMRGDWSAEPTSRPETLGLDLESRHMPAGPAVGREPESARQMYERAAAAFEAAGAQRGLAALELRRAHLDRLEGSHSTARRRLDAVLALAEAAGDGAMLQLARVHRALLDVEAGDVVRPEEVGGEIAAWVKGVGSYSYARGLARLCLASARGWREAGDFLRGRTALRISDTINSGVGAVQEPALVGAEAAELYGGANYRRALLVLTELEIDEAIANLAARPDALAWLQLVDRASRAYSAAAALRDSTAIEAAAGRLARLRQLADALRSGTGSEQLPFVAPASLAVQGMLETAQVQAPLYRATLARSTGLPEESARRFEEALAVARRLEPQGGLLTVIVLATMGRREEARPMVDGLVSGGQLPADMATLLLMRVGDAEGAGRALARLDAPAAQAGRRESIQDIALRAEIHAANGEWPAAAQHAGDGLDQFERRLAALSRDVLRISASDDSEVVSLYTTAMRARLALGEDDAGIAASFELSDRCRGMALTDLLRDDSSTASPAGSAALRRWLRAGVELAQVFEGAAQTSTAEARRLRDAIARAERKLDEAEVELHSQAPELLAGRRRPRPSHELNELQSLLGAEALLIQYHSFDDELFMWAITSRGARLVRRRAETAGLTGAARRFHRLCADAGSDESERASLGARLAEQLVEPLKAELAGYRRVVIVPHAGLSLLPFHLLPFDGNVLGATRTVSYLPAASIAPRWRGQGPPQLAADALVVGDPRYAPALGLSRLPAARTEAAVIGRLLGSPVLLAEAATGEAVAARISQARVVHLATHGRAIDGAPNSAELALADGDRLTIAELMGMDTSIELAVLSACDTGRGTSTASGDVVGLARALLAAGARDIVVSLWPVDDRAACLTMVYFYERLLAGDDISTALAAAQAELRRRSEAEQASWYAELAASLGQPDSAPLAGTREWRGTQRAALSSVDSRHPALWGPFVHIGLQGAPS